MATIALPDLVGKVRIDTSGVDRALSGVKKTAAVAGVAGAAAVATFAAKGVQEFAAFEKGMNEVFTLLPGISEQAMGDLSNDTRDFVKEMGVAHSEAVPALYQALSAGVPKDNVFEFLEQSQKAAVGGVTTLETAVNGISGVVNAYGKENITAAEASDLMFTTVRLGKTTFEELSASLGDVTPIAGALGVSFEEVSAALAASTAITGNTAKSTTGLKSLLAELGKEGQIAADKFKKISGKTFPEYIASGGTLSGALDLMKDRADKTGGSILNMFGGIEAGQSALQLTGSKTFTDNVTQMQNAAGATEGAYEQMDQGLSRAWDRIKVNVADAAISVGLALGPIANAALDVAGSFVDQMQPAIDSIITVAGAVVDALGAVFGMLNDNRGTVTVIAAVITAVLLPAIVSMGAQATISAARTVAAWVAQKVAAVTNGAQTLLWHTYLAVAWVQGAVVATASAARQAAAWVVGKAQAAASVAVQVAAAAAVVGGWVLMGVQSLFAAAKVAAAWLIAMGPIGLVIAAVIGVVALIIKNWDTIKRVTTRVWQAVSGAVSRAWTSIVNAVKAFGTRVADAARAVWELILTGIKRYIGFYVAVFRGIGRIVSVVAEAFGRVLAAVREKLGAVLDFVRGIPDRVIGLFRGAGKLLYDTGVDIIQGLLDGAGSLLSKIGQFFLDKIPGWIKTPFKKALGIASPSKVFKRYGVNISQGLIDGLDGTRSQVVASIEGIADRLVKQGEKAAAKVARSFQKGLAAAAGTRDRLTERLEARESDLADAIQARTDYAESIASALIGAGGVTSTVENGATDFESIVANMKAATDEATAFGAQLEALRKLNLRDDLVDQIAQKGAEEGGAAAAAILGAGQAGVKTVNAQQAALVAAAQKTGKNVAQDMKGAGVAAARGLVEGLESQIKTITKSIRKMTRQMLRTIKKELRMSSPSKVFADVGANVGAGLVGGIEASTAGVDRAIGRLVRVPTLGQVTPLSGGTVDNSRRIEVTSYSTAASARDIADEIAWAERTGAVAP